MKKILNNKWCQPAASAKRDYSRQIAFLNRYSILFHALLACVLVFMFQTFRNRRMRIFWQPCICIFLQRADYLFYIVCRLSVSAQNADAYYYQLYLAAAWDY